MEENEAIAIGSMVRTESRTSSGWTGMMEASCEADGLEAVFGLVVGVGLRGVTITSVLSTYHVGRHLQGIDSGA